MVNMRNTALLVLIILFGVSCNTKTAEPIKDESAGTYFSIREYILDQVDVYYGQPFGITKIVTMNAKTDSINTNADAISWAPIFKIFFDTDISDPKFLDKYEFSQFTDSASMTDNYYYEAKDKKLFTRKLHIMANPANHRVSSIYIETLKDSKWGARTQRLYYEPVKSIQIQEFESDAVGDKKEVRIEYRFL